MIRECEEHGYFRDERCPYCGEEGKFIMSDYEVEKIGRTLAAILRHGKFGLEMDSQGNVSLRDVMAKIRERNPRMNWLRSRHIEALVETDPKGRYVISGGKIRATYGHTIPLDIKLDCENIPDELFYPATQEEAELLLESGIFPSDRAMVSGDPRDRHGGLHGARLRYREGRQDGVPVQERPRRCDRHRGSGGLGHRGR